MTADYHDHERRDVFASVPPGRRLLDLGGGYGRTAAALKALGRCEVAGVLDLMPPDSPGTLDFAIPGNIADPAVLDRLAAAWGPFDTILCLDILEHLVDPWACVAQLDTMLAPGGTIVASIPNIRYYGVSLPLLLRGRWRYVDAGLLDRTHLRFFVRETAIELMTSSGLVLEEVRRTGGFRRLNRAIDALSLGLLGNLTCEQYIIRVRKEA